MPRLVAAAAALLLGAAAVAGGGGGDDAAAAAAGGGKPNVVMVMTDDQTVRDMRVMGQVRRRIGRRGVRFSNAFATFPLCCPSRASILTGRYAHNHGVTANNAADGGGYRNYDDRRSLPVALKRAGYRTAMIGKYLNGYKGRRVPRGWSHWAGKAKGGWTYDYELNINGRMRHFGNRARDYQTDVLTRLSQRFIAKASRRAKPFFLLTSYSAPHTESLPEGKDRVNPRPARRHRGAFKNAGLPRGKSFNERDVSDKPRFIARTPRLDRAKRQKLRRVHRSRLASLLAVDEGVAALLRTLRRRGELSNTYVIFLSDNGYLFGEHRQARKTLLYEESVRVPLYVRGPGIPRGKVRRQIVGNIDLAPTIHDLTRTSALLEPDGVSILPFARRADAGANRDILLENRRSAAVRAPGYVYMEHDRDGDGNAEDLELYDLRRSKDPEQLRSRHSAPAYEQIRDALAARLDELRDCRGAGCN